MVESNALATAGSKVVRRIDVLLTSGVQAKNRGLTQASPNTVVRWRVEIERHF